MDAAGELAQLAERDRELLGQPVDERLGVGVAHARLQEPQVEREADELLLGAVVEVALEAPARGVGRLHDAHPRDPQLLHPRAQVGLQALVVERERRGGGRRLDELGPVSSAASWTIAATRTPLRSTAVHARPLPGSGRSTGRPASSTNVSRSGSQ